MDKHDLLAYLARVQQEDALEVACAFGVSYEAAAMALLRLVRQGLAARYLDSDSRLYWYELTPKGETRLDFLRQADGSFF